ncbi:hypothetical protein [Amycolatopsis pithecellobii]|uniref:Uncharacterized protein n=1 Tax=Amycolatopsis pithecellobii TaxID=664692 RepID=A0A6N7Z8V4_9PSEU|nr:hypothetical protein [Amycolatopsis pithecellobii]MTD57176.1 hypothetical protein [Amycolatopsis pithecellobii]
MGSQHADPALTVRPPAEVKDRADAVLKERGLPMRGFVVACLAALADDPDAFLAHLAKHWPAEKPRGRPRATDRAADRPAAAGAG